MFLRRFTDYILQSRLHAVLVAFVIAVAPVIGSISIVIAALITLRKGSREGALVVAAATLGAVLQYIVYPASNESGMAMAVILALIASNVLTWLFAIMLRQYSYWNLTLEVAALVGIFAVIAAHIVYPGIQDWWQTQLTAYLSKAASNVDLVKPDAETIAAQVELVGIMKQYATGLVIASLLFNALLQLLIARWWQAVMFNPGELRKELHQIRLSYATGILFVIGAVLSYGRVEMAMDIMPVLLMVFFIAGLSLLHYLIAPTNFSWMLLILMYMAVMWLFPVSIVIVSFIALLDTTVNIRQRITRKI
jgi:hypothetical protein